MGNGLGLGVVNNTSLVKEFEQLADAFEGGKAQVQLVTGVRVEAQVVFQEV